ncbi:MAG TPA: radical SAM protein [Sandaracinaceae bacterium LLY-WYZ-13_1]|nr:radical SAM protein [Sandaracinaceae bacterium LLY-WYZ-13_1]
MRVTLIGADFEENLGVGMIAAVAREAGHDVCVVPFDDPGALDAVARRALGTEPAVIGLSIQFQHRAHEFLALARRLRAGGFEGHLTAGGQFPSLAWEEVLGRGHGVDTVVLHEGEETFPALLDALARGRRVGDVPGLAFVADDGAVARSPGRRLPDDLDRLPFPVRYRGHTEHFGVPFIPLMGGRGCWGKCSYCSITSYFRDARAHGGGKTLRLRSPENVAAEMALLASQVGRPPIFCFHDDNFTLPRPADTLERVRRIRAALDEYGVGDVGIVGKARPDTLTPELAEALAAHGVIRLYVGVENASERGGAHLGRGMQTRAVGEALRACRRAGIFNCYNLLIFEPEATLDDVRENAAFIRDHAEHPVNFCRAEPYFGTPLHRTLEHTQALGGSYLGWNYRIADDRTELLFRVCAAAFRERNFAADGVANRTMGLGYGAKVLERFYPDDGRLSALSRRATALTRDISLDTAGSLERALDFVAAVDPGDRERVERATARLGLEIAEADQRWHARLDRIYGDMKAFADGTPPRRSAVEPTRKLRSLARSLAVGSAIAVGAAGCECGTVVDPVPRDAGMDAMVVDPPPRDAGVDAMVVDPPPRDAGMDATVVDPPPPDAGVDEDAGRDAGMVVDPAPIDGGVSARTPDERPRHRLDLIDQWRDSTPRRAVRSEDLPLFDPPEVRLAAEREGDHLRVRVEGAPPTVGLRWSALGAIEGEGPEVRWRPFDDDERIRVAVRSRGGVAVVSLRATQARG